MNPQYYLITLAAESEPIRVEGHAAVTTASGVLKIDDKHGSGEVTHYAPNMWSKVVEVHRT